VLASVGVALALPAVRARAREVPAGFRELVAHLNSHVDPAREAVVMVIDDRIHPGWSDMELAGFHYYPLNDLQPYELHLNADRDPRATAILDDPRGLYLVVLLGDPSETVRASGRSLRRLTYDGDSVSQLPFGPYRLMYVAPR
jgi:hypothetical protein